MSWSWSDWVSKGEIMRVFCGPEEPLFGFRGLEPTGGKQGPRAPASWEVVPFGTFAGGRLSTYREHAERAGEPDLLLWRSPEVHPVPEGMESAACLKVALVGDWNLALQTLRKTLTRFDVIVTDTAGVRAFERLGFQNVMAWPLFSYDPSLHRVLDEQGERDLDVVMVGSLNHDVHARRARILALASDLAGAYRVRFCSGVHGEAYARLLNRAKIVLNCSVRSELNMRAYEAPACGALLFMERSNEEVRSLFTDRRDCVLYDEEDLQSLLIHYLEHDEERLRLAAHGRERVRQATLTHHLEGLALHLCERGFLQNAAPHGTDPLSVRERALELLSSRRQIAVRAAAEMSLDPATRALVRMHCAQEATSPEGQIRELERAAQAFEEVLEKDGGDIVVHYNMAELFTMLGRRGLAIEQWRRVAALLEEEGHVASDGLYSRVYDAFKVAWEQAALSEDENALRDLLKWRVYGQLARLEYACGDRASSERSFDQALRARPDLAAHLWSDYANLLVARGDQQTALKGLREAVAERPFEPRLWRQLSDLLFKGAKLAECADYCEVWLRRVEAMPALADEGFWLRQRLAECSVHFQGMRSFAGTITRV